MALYRNGGCGCVRFNSDCLDWKQEAERLKFDEGLSWMVLNRLSQLNRI